MKLTNKVVGGLLRFKNRQLKDERARSRALGETNSILSAYVASLIEERGGAKISREKIKKAIGQYVASVRVEGGDYVISINRCEKETEDKCFDMNSNECADDSLENKEHTDVRD